MNPLIRLHHAIRRIETGLCVGLMLVMLSSILLQIAETWISRVFVDFHSHAWTQELALMLFVWLTFVGASLGVDARAHFGIDVIVKAAPRRMQRAVVLLAYLAMVAVVLVLVVYGIFLSIDGMNQSFSTLRLGSWRVPRTAAYLAIPVSGLLMLRYVLIQMWQAWTAAEVFPERETPK